MIAIYAYKWTSLFGHALDDRGELTATAKQWQSALSGFPLPVIARAIDELGRTATEDIFPDLGQFKDLCLKYLLGDIPSAEKAMYIIANAKTRAGSMVDRYRHPLVLAIIQDGAFDAYRFNKTTTVECLKMVRPIHKRLLTLGWAEFGEEDFKQYQALPKLEAPSETVRFNLKLMRDALK